MWIYWLTITWFSSTAVANYQDMYCGDVNCYDLLGVTRDSSKVDISKSYRKLAGQWHPDRFKTAEEKQTAQAMFMKIATGYEVLKDEESRKEYDYMLDNPEEYFTNYYRYYKRRVAPKVDVRVVILSIISIASAVQYYSAWYNFDQAIVYLATVPKYRYQAMEIGREKGLLHSQKSKGMTKSDVKKLEDDLVRSIIADMMDQNGGYERPQVRNILWMKIILLPMTLYKWIIFQVDWIWRFWILQHEYTDKEKEYLVSRNLKLSEKQWNALSPLEKDGYMRRQLWVREEWQIYCQEEEEKERIRLAESGRSKQERRWLKHSDNRMTFDENYDW